MKLSFGRGREIGEDVFLEDFVLIKDVVESRGISLKGYCEKLFYSIEASNWLYAIFCNVHTIK